MEIKFSRHAKRRIKLYKIPEEIILNILKEIYVTDGEHDIVKVVDGFKYPIKIVFSVECQVITVITSYPVKKGL